MTKIETELRTGSAAVVMFCAFFPSVSAIATAVLPVRSPRVIRHRDKTMYHDFNYEATLASSLRAAVAARRRAARGPGPRLHPQLHAGEPGADRRASRPQRRSSSGSSTRSPRIEYLCIFGIVEEFILPFLVDHARPGAARRRLAGPRAAQLRQRGSQAHPFVQALPRSVRARLPGRVQDDRPVRSDRRQDPQPRSARGRPDHPDDRVDDAAALSRQRPRQRRHRSARSRAC